MKRGTRVVRYSSRVFPPYRYVPGRTPHPRRDPKGHSFASGAFAVRSFDPENWQQCEPYLFGVDLFNHGYWWEAHECWESVWIAAGKRTIAGFFIQGLIQIAAARLKASQGCPRGAELLKNKGLCKLAGVSGRFMGIDVAQLRRQIHRWASGKARNRLLIRLHGAAEVSTGSIPIRPEGS